MNGPLAADQKALAEVNRLADELTTRRGFVDPTILSRVKHSPGWHDPEWLQAVTGLPNATMRGVDYRTAVFVMLAAEADHDNLLARAHARVDENLRRQDREADVRRRERLAGWEAWVALRARIPVTVEVWHNWYGRAHGSLGNQWSVDHIVVQSDFEAGRLRRGKGMALCQARPDDPRFRGVFPNDDGERVPSCKQCLRIAERWMP